MRPGGGAGRRGGVPRARALPSPDDQRRLPRRDDHGPPRAGGDGLRPQRRRRQPPPRRVHRARPTSIAASRCWRERSRGWRARARLCRVGACGAARRLLPHRGSCAVRPAPATPSASVVQSLRAGRRQRLPPAAGAGGAARPTAHRGEGSQRWPGRVRLRHGVRLRGEAGLFRHTSKRAPRGGRSGFRIAEVRSPTLAPGAACCETHADRAGTPDALGPDPSAGHPFPR